MKKKGKFLKSLGLFILCLSAPLALICAPLIISNIRKPKIVKPDFRIQNECVEYTQNDGKTWDKVFTLAELFSKYGGTANGIKSITINDDKSDNTKTTYIITFDNNETYEYVVNNGKDGKDGADGSIVTIGQDGYWYIDGIKTDVKAVGQDGTNGTNGTNGKDGKDGADGSVVTIGQDGYWYIDGIKTDVKAVGQDGTNGTNGTNGQDGKDGQDGISYYVYIRYASEEPTATTELKTTADAWMGIYRGPLATAPTDYTKYTWCNIKGEDGQDGKDGKDGKDGQDGKDGKDGTDADVDRYTVTYDYSITDEYFQVDSVSGELKKSEQIKSTQWITSLPEIKEEYANRFEGWFIQGTNKQIEKYDFVGGDVTLEARLIPGLYYYSSFTPWDELLSGGKIKLSSDKKIINDCATTLQGELIIDKNITSIGEKAFQYCRDLTKVILTKNVTTICTMAFADCDSLKEIKLPRSVTSIYYGSYYCSAFRNCSSLERIVVEQGNNNYDSRENCNAIIGTDSNSLLVGCKNTIIPNDVESIAEYAFSKCSGLTEITIPNSVTFIGEYAFSKCANLTKADLSNNNISDIYSYTFYGCSSLTELNIPSSVEEIYEYAFLGCTGLETINVDPENMRYDSRNNCNAIIDHSWHAELIYGCKTTIIPQDVNIIGKSAFRDCTTLTEITIPENIVAIREEAFYGCAGLTEITIPINVELIEDSAFDCCENLKTVIIDSAFVAEGFDDWWECGGLLANSSIVKVYVAEHCDVVSSVILVSYFYKLTETDKPNYTKHVIAPGLYQNTIQVKTWDELITDGIITLSEDQTTITDYNTNIYGDLIISDTIIKIAENSFNGCYSLYSINISESVESIAKGAFVGCVNLQSVAVSAYNDHYCSGGVLNILVERATNTLILGLGDGEDLELYGITTIAVGAFTGNTTLYTINIPNSVKTIEEYAFFGCGSLREITFEIPVSSTDGLTTIGEYAFANCSNLEAIEIVNSVTVIGNSAFEGCDIKYVTIESPTIANSLTGKDLNTYGGLLAHAETVAITIGLDVSGSTYLASAYELKRSSYWRDIYVLKT